MYAWQATVQDEAGARIPLPVVTVYENDGVTLAAIYNEAGGSLPNPLTGSVEGFVQFWAEAGQYKIEGAAGGDETEVWAVTIDAPAFRAELAADRAEAAASSMEPYLPPSGPFNGLLNSISIPEAQASINVSHRRVYQDMVNGETVVVKAEDQLPAWHYSLTGGSTVNNFDVSGVRLYSTYVFMNNGGIRSTVSIDCGEFAYFKSGNIGTDNVTTRSINIGAGEIAYVTRATTGVFMAFIVPSTFWENASGGVVYKRNPDMTYDLIYTRSASITPSSGSTVTVNAIFNLDNAYIQSIAMQPTSASTVAPAIPLQVTGMGTPSGLLTTQFVIYNNNAVTWTIPVKVYIKGAVLA